MRNILRFKRTILILLLFFAYITQATYYNLGAFWNSSSSGSGQWTWMGGDPPWKPNWISDFGTLGVASASNRPTGRTEPFMWADNSGNIWMYGGSGYDSLGSSKTCLADLWKYNTATDQWTWMGGSGDAGINAVFGTKGVGSVSNTPGSRSGGMSWLDPSGNYLWLFGGFSEANPGGPMADTWRYEISSGQWTWMAGPNTSYELPTYGAKGVAGASYYPGSRDRGSVAIDSSGNVWLYGGYVNRGTRTYLNDLWKFNVGSGQWAWMGGGDGSNETTSQNQAGVYGTKGIANAANWPGSRESTMWIDTNDDLWIYGGFGYDDGTNAGTIGMDDVWMYDHLSGQWTWKNGSKVGGATQVTGTKGVSAAGNTPGGRYGFSSFVDADKALWVFGGDREFRWGSTGSEFWVYDSTINEWTWVAGPTTDYDAGSWGTQGTGSVSNIPPAKFYAGSTVASNQQLYLFGGETVDANGTFGIGDDFWSFAVNTLEWTWLKGHKTFPDYRGAYGTLGVASGSNWPGIRQNGAMFTDSSDNLWLFGGHYGFEWNLSGRAAMNSIMKYNTTTNQWTWVGGDKALCGTPTYGVQGTPSTSNIPPAVGNFGSTRDASGNFWFFGGTADCASWDNPVQLWKFNPTTSEWTFMSGFMDTNYRGGVYGTIQTPSTSNYPGSRTMASMTADASGNIWIFGGVGADVNTTWGQLNDLWRFNPATSEWTWMGGSQVVDQNGSYGIKGVESSFNQPGGRSNANFWVGPNGMLYLFGGWGFDSVNNYKAEMNDVWRYNTATKYWTWVNGSDATGGGGNLPTYGTVKSFSTTNTPGGRGEYSKGFQRGTGLFWTIGGFGVIGVGNDYDQGELWAYDPNGNQWACMSNCNQYAAPVYNTKGVSAPTSTPGNRLGTSADIDSKLNIWLYGGFGRVTYPMPYGDLWRYK